MVPELQRLNAGHAPAVLAFELENRAYFAASVSDRGDDFFEQYTDRHSAVLAEQEAGIRAFYVLVAEDGSVLGRFNLVFAEDGTAELGYRVAQHAAGRGVATAAVQELCRLAAARHELHTLRAGTSRDNAASQKVLVKAGFVPDGPADPAHIGGKQGTPTRISPSLCSSATRNNAADAPAVSRTCSPGMPSRAAIRARNCASPADVPYPRLSPASSAGSRTSATERCGA